MGRIANGATIFICAIFLACCARNDPPPREKNAVESRVDSTASSTPATAATPATTATGAQRANDPLARAPRVAAARMRRNAAHAAANAAGVLSDPMLDVQYMRMPSDPMYGSGGMIELGQTLPRWGERDGMRAMAAADVAMADADLAMARGEVLARLTMYHAQARAAQAKAAAYQENVKRAENLAELIAKSAAATGGARMAEVLTLRSRAATLALSASEAQIAAADALGRGRALLNLPASADIPDPGIPEITFFDAERNPRVRLAKAAHLQAQAQLTLAASRSHPEVGVRAGWQREGRDAFDEYRVGVTIAIPLRPSAWRGPQEAALRREDAADLDAAGAIADADELRARVGRAREQAIRARLVAKETKQRLSLELENIASAAATGEPSGTAMLFERLDMLANTEVMAVMAEADADMAGADLWMLMPTPDTILERP